MNDQFSINIEKQNDTPKISKMARKVKQIVYGGMDGVISTFAIIAASIGSDVDNKKVIILAIANVIADGLSMGFSDFISSYSERRYILAEKEKENIQYELNGDREKQQLVSIYKLDGMCEDDAIDLVNILGKYPTIFIDHIMFKELDMNIPCSLINIIKSSTVTLVSFFFYGVIPIISYVVVFFAGIKNEFINFGITCGVTVITLFGIGALEGKVTKQNMIYSGTLIAFNGSIASLAAFGIGYGLNAIP